jgi:hypothetical protein
MEDLECRMTRDELLKIYADIIDQQKEEIDKLKAEIYDLKQRNEKLSKRHPTTEEALAQYHWLKQNSRRNK